MQPPFNSFPPQFPNQSNNPNPPFQSQGIPANPSSMPVQPQMGPFNPQIPPPFSNPTFSLPNLAALIAQQPALVAQIGMALQNQSNNMNANPMFMNQFNSCPPQGQPFPVNFPNFPQQLNQNMGYPMIPNLNPVMPNPLLNPSQFVAPQRPNFFPNPSFVGGGQEANANQKSFVEKKGVNQMPQTPNSQRSAPFRNQGKPGNIGHNNSPTSNSNNSPRKEFRKNMKYQKSQFPHLQNGKRKFASFNEHKGTAASSGYERAAKSGHTNFTEEAGERKRSFAITYTEQEIKLWREERKKNHPSNANKKKEKLGEAKTNSEITDEDAKLRREQLKEILAKQAQLGVEVAEIPSHYLQDSEKQLKDNEENRSPPSKKGKSGKRQEKRGRRNKRDRFSKRQKSGNKDASEISSLDIREPSLLQKLLSVDIKRDKQHLLQAFRFIVSNKFFKDFPDKPLEFPKIVVKEEEAKEAGSGKLQLSGNGYLKSKSVEAGSKKCNAEMNSVVKDEDEEEKSSTDISSYVIVAKHVLQKMFLGCSLLSFCA